MAAAGGGGGGGGGGGLADIGLFIVRLAGIALATHGYKKVFGGGIDEDFVNKVGELGFPLPKLFAWAAGISELLGGAMVALGLYTRIAAIFAGTTMFVAAFLRHANDSFDKRELALLYLMVLLGLAFTGPGKWSIDGLARKAA